MMIEGLVSSELFHAGELISAPGVELYGQVWLEQPPRASAIEKSLSGKPGSESPQKGERGSPVRLSGLCLVLMPSWGLGETISFS